MPARLLLLLAIGTLQLLLPQSAISQDTALDQPRDISTRRFGHDWPTFLGPHRNGKSEETGLTFDWPAEGPPIVWQAPLGTGYSAPSVSQGRLFHFDRHEDQDRLTCRNAETGEELWFVEHSTQYSDLLGYNNGPRCSPLVAGKCVYTMSASGILQCVGVEDGKRRWMINTSKEFGVVTNFFGVGSTPVVYDDLLIANIGGSPPGEPEDIYSARGHVQGSGTGVVAFDLLTGEVRWQATDELASYASPVIAEIGGRPFCFVFARGGLVALDPRTGSVDFQFPWRATLLESVNAASPVVVGSQVFISETYELGSALLRARAGGCDVVWKDTARGRDKALELHWNTPIFHDGFLYGSSGRHASTAELRCVKWSTGEVQWSERGLARCSLLYADKHLICLSEDGTLLLLRADPERFHLVQSVVLRDTKGDQLLDPDAWTAPILARGLLYVRGSDRLVCLELRP